MTELELAENPLRTRPISLSSRSLSWAVVKPHQAGEAYSMDARVVNRATSNNCGDPSYSRISAFGPECHTSRFKRAMCISYQPHVDVHKGGGVWLMWTHVEGVKNLIILWTS